MNRTASYNEAGMFRVYLPDGSNIYIDIDEPPKPRRHRSSHLLEMAKKLYAAETLRRHIESTKVELEANRLWGELLNRSSNKGTRSYYIRKAAVHPSFRPQSSLNRMVLVSDIQFTAS